MATSPHFEYCAMNKDKSGAPWHYHAWFTQDALTRLRAEGEIELNDGEGNYLTVQRSPRINGFEISARKTGRNLSLFIDDSSKTIEDLAEFLKTSPAIKVENSDAKLSFMPYDFPKVDSDYRLSEMNALAA